MEIKDNLKKALGITTVTLVGFFGDFPRKYGNCFSVRTENEQYRIVNFNYENLTELINNNIVTWPIKISTLSNNIAIICDERIPNEWYSNRFCETCTPISLLPIPQRLKHFLDIERGIREERDVEINGVKSKLISIKVGK